MNQAIYPVSGNERHLPVYLTGIGFNEREAHFIRNDGYHNPQFIYTIKGKGCLKVDGKEYIQTKNCCFFLPAKYPHEYYSIGDVWETHWVTFNGFAVSEMLCQTGFNSAMIKQLTDVSRFEKLFRKMFVTLKSDKITGNFTCSGLMYEFLIEAYRAFSEMNSSVRNDRSRILVPVLAYIDENFSSDITLEQLSQAAEVSQQHLCRIFKEVFNMRPMEYIGRKRVAKAKELLNETNQSISEISVAVGYDDNSYFSSVFKRYESITPSEYRKNSGL